MTTEDTFNTNVNEELNNPNTKPDKVGNPPKIALYAKAAKHAPKAIARLAIEMEKGDNSNARVSAAKALLAKCIPDLSAAEITGKDGQSLELFINLGSGFVPASIRIPAPSIAGTPTGQPPLQSTSLASESKKD